MPAAPAQPRIRVEHQSKRLGATEAVVDLSLAVGEGELFGFLGPNGAGKTTTISLLCTLLRPTAGRAWVNGFDVARQPAQVRRTIGLVFQWDYWGWSGFTDRSMLSTVVHVKRVDAATEHRRLRHRWAAVADGLRTVLAAGSRRAQPASTGRRAAPAR